MTKSGKRNLMMRIKIWMLLCSWTRRLQDSMGLGTEWILSFADTITDGTLMN